MNKEQKIWFLVAFINGLAFTSIITMAVYDIKFKYGFYIAVLFFGIAYAGLLMFAMAQYMSTREIVSILLKKVREW